MALFRRRPRRPEYLPHPAERLDRADWRVILFALTDRARDRHNTPAGHAAQITLEHVAAIAEELDQ